MFIYNIYKLMFGIVMYRRSKLMKLYVSVCCLEIESCKSKDERDDYIYTFITIDPLSVDGDLSGVRSWSDWDPCRVGRGE